MFNMHSLIAIPVQKRGFNTVIHFLS